MKKIEVISKHKNQILFVIIGVAVVACCSCIVIFMIQQRNSDIMPLSEKEVSLLGDGKYAFNDFVIGTPYKEMKKRLKKTEDFAPNIRESENKGQSYQLVEHRMRLEAPGYQNGYISYSFCEKKFHYGRCELYFSSYAEALVYMNRLVEPLLDLDQLKEERPDEKRYRIKDMFDTQMELYVSGREDNGEVVILFYKKYK